MARQANYGSCNIDQPGKMYHECYSGMNVMGAGCNQMFLVGFKFHFTRENTCICDPEPRIRKLIVPKGVNLTIIFIKEHSIKLPFKYVSLFIN